MHLIKHGYPFYTGTRVLTLCGRNKDDSNTRKSIMRVTHSEKQFNYTVDELVEMSRPDERLYCSAGPRDVNKAIRRFKQLQMDADYDDDPTLFYKRINSAWASALMRPSSQDGSYWIFDIDSDEEKIVADEAISKLIEDHGLHIDPYRYQSKNGWHYMVKAFNKSLMPKAAQDLLSFNALILLGY